MSYFRFFALQRLFRFVMTELKRADDVLRGPLLRHVINSVNGCSTVHAFKNQEFFIERLVLSYSPFHQ